MDEKSDFVKQDNGVF